MLVWRNERGQTLVEVIVALALLALAVGSAGALATASVHSNAEAGRRSQAVGLATREMEALRSYRDGQVQAGTWPWTGVGSCVYFVMVPATAPATGWTAYYSPASSFATSTVNTFWSYGTGSTGDGDATMNNFSQYKRQIKLCNNGLYSGQTYKKVEVQVQWTESGTRTDSATLETVLTNWNQQ